ncbi:UNVERIFIED_CONTAM: Retrovirus-related Pol polyprotein from transposon.6 [Sesamum calycinum]|uniref:Retrovirus-related Pol polyprotein from transposon.6 n=1 Tax=Sesamum calycinum TaxID=2727403 RepID=A0AAW2JZP5_9LAMI
MQLARQGKISLEEDSAATNVITIESEHVNGNKDSCNTTHGDNITSNDDTLFGKEDSSDTDDCMSTITFTDEDLLLGSKPHNHPLFVAGYPPHDLRLQSRRTKVVGIIRMQLTMEDMVSSALFHVIDAKTSYNILLATAQGFVPSTQEEEGGHEALAIGEKGFDPKAFKLLIKAGYDPKEKLNLGKLPPEATGKKLHGLNATQIMLKEKGHAIQDSRVDGEVEEEDAEDAPAELEEDVFAWSYKEMPGLDPKVVVHHLSVKKGARPVKQGQRRFRPELIPLIEGEVNKLIEVSFIREVKYPMWISSIVPVRKKNGQIRAMKLYPSWMDRLGTNQIRMAPTDEELTAFRTPKGIYAIKVMPFGLKNAGATYQRAMQKIFDDMLHKNVECYVDDLL